MENVCTACREEKSVRGFSFLIVIFYSFQYNEAMTKMMGTYMPYERYGERVLAILLAGILLITNWG